MIGDLAFIGLDGLSWRVVYHYYREYGVWRNLVRLAANGLSAVSRCIPPYTPPSWITIFTGVSPFKHGIYGFYRYVREGDCYRLKLVKTTDLRYPLINEVLAFHKYKGIVYNIYPSYPVNGLYTRGQVIVSDILSPKFYVYPKPYMDRYSKYFNKPLPRSSNYSNKWVQELGGRVYSVLEGLMKLMDDFNHDFLVTVFREPDYLMHYLQYVAYGRYDEYVSEIFNLLDDFIGYVSSRYRYVYIASDHGFDVYTDRVNLYGILWRHGLHRYKGSLKTRIIVETLGLKPVKYLMKTVLSSLRSQRIYYRLRRIFQKRSVSSARDSNLIRDLIVMDNISADNAWVVYTPNEQGIVSYVRKVFSKYDRLIRIIYEGDLGDSGIRVFVLEPIDGKYYMNDPSLHYSPTIYFASSRHSVYGVFIGYGPRICRHSFHIIDNVDILPTILSSIDMPLPTYIDGKSIIETMESRRIDYRRLKEIAVKVKRFKKYIR